MGIHTTHIFLRDYAMHVLPEALGRVWTEHAPEPSRQLVALFPKPLPEPRDGDKPRARRDAPWTTLLEPGFELCSTMADKLCRAIRGEVVFACVASETFSFSLERFADGKRVEKLDIPAAKAGDPGRPRVIDAEQVGWDEMRRRGIPPELRYLRLDELEILPMNDSTPARMALYVTPGDDAEALPGYFRWRIRQPRTESAGPPPIFNLFDGKNVLVDVYALAGKADAGQIDQLLQVLETIARRKRPSQKLRYIAALELVTDDEPAREACKKLVLERYRKRLAEGPLAFELLFASDKRG